MSYTKYQHHKGFGEVWVQEDLKGEHGKHCLCYSCHFLDRVNRENNCPIANAVYALNRLANITTPVWECERFEEIEKE